MNEVPEPVELKEWELTEERREHFQRWVEGLVHHDFVDVRNDTVNFSQPRKPLSESRIALVSTGGMRHVTQLPFDISKPDGDWSIRAIPSDTPPAEITIDHTHYNHADADDRIRELAESRVIGEVSETFYGMMGFIPNGAHLVDESGPDLARRLRQDGVDVVLLTPS
jgi:D-proline reductase (dithiol) PrdB